MILVPVPPDRIGAAWSYLEPFFVKMAERGRGRESAHSLGGFVANGTYLCWVVLDATGNAKAVVLCEWAYYAHAKVLRIIGCVGEGRRQWLPLLSQIEDFARANGASDVEIVCRKGWARELADYKLTHVVMARSLNDASSLSEV